MTNQNSAARAASQIDIAQRLRDQAGHYEQDPGYMIDAALNRAAADEIERLRAELCKLRAPVPEPAIVGWRDPDCGRMAQKGPPHGYNRYSEALMTVAEHRALIAAALASAPVAVEHPDGLRTLLAELPGMRDDPKKGDAVFRCGVNGALDVVADRIRELLRSAPVAGEAQQVAYRVLRKTHDGDWKDDGRCWCDGAPSTDLKNDIAQRADRWRIEYAYASPQASAEDAIMASDDVAQLVAFIFDRFGQPGDAGALPDNVAAAVRRLERGIQPQADKDGGQQRAAFDHPVFAFLLGEGQLHGVDFGERAPGAVGKWWWRKDLRAALSAIQGATDAADRTLITKEQEQ